MTRHPTNLCHGVRPAFSLPELLVSMALIIFIMAVLSTAFAAASKVFRDLKAAGDLSEQLRGVMTMMRRDLAYPHFTGNTRLSDNSVWGATNNRRPPGEGFFRIYQGPNAFQPWPPTGLLFGEQPDTISTDFALHFTARLPGSRPMDFFSTQVPNPGPIFNNAELTQAERDKRYMVPPNFTSDWAEIVYWLTPQLDGNNNQELSDLESAAPQPLYQLRRRARLVWPIGTGTRPAVPPNGANYAEISVPAPQAPPAVANAAINRIAQTTAPPYRFGMQVVNPLGGAAHATSEPTYAGLLRAGGYPANRPDDIIAANVLSFDIQILLHQANTFVHLSDPSVRRYSGWTPTTQAKFCNPGYRWDGKTPYVFDTWSRLSVGRYRYNNNNWSEPSTPATIPLFRERDSAGQYTGDPIRIRAVKVTLRIWDPKTQHTRQVSMVQDL